METDILLKPGRKNDKSLQSTQQENPRVAKEIGIPPFNPQEQPAGLPALSNSPAIAQLPATRTNTSEALVPCSPAPDTPPVKQKKSRKNGEAPKYLSEIYDELPSNCIFNKVRTGCGGTTLEIENPNRNSIIAVPYKNLIDNKCSKDKKYENGIELFPVDGDISAEHIAHYLNHHKVFKIMTTWNSLEKVINTIELYNPKLLKEFFLLIDEAHTLLNSYILRREAIQIVLKNYRRFNKWCFMTATPSRREYQLKELKEIKIQSVNQWSLDPVYVDNIYCPGLQKKVGNIINQHLEEGYPTNMHIFVNSVEIIDRLIKNCKLTPENCSATWSNASKKKVLGNKRNKIINSVSGANIRKINFYTSTSFEGCDIIDPDGETIIVSHGYQQTTMNDIFTTFRQITGRLRNSNYNRVIRHYYSINHTDDSLPWEKIKERIEKKETGAQKLVEIYNESHVFDEPLEQLALKYLVEDSSDPKPLTSQDTGDQNEKVANDIKSNKKKIPKKVKFDPNLVTLDLLHNEITRSTYKKTSELFKSQREAFALLDNAPDDFYQPSDRIARKKSRVSIPDIVVEYCALKQEESLSDNDQRRIDLLLSRKDNLLHIYSALGPEWLTAKKRKPKEITEKLKSIDDLLHLPEILRLLKDKHDLRIDEFYTNKQLIGIFTEIYTQLGLSKKAQAKDIENYFEVHAYKRNKDQMHGCKLLSEKSLNTKDHDN